MKELNFLAMQRNKALDQVVQVQTELANLAEEYDKVVAGIKEVYSKSSKAQKTLLKFYFPNLED